MKPAYIILVIVLVVLLVFMFKPSSVPSPESCRDFGVNVPDGTPVTGEIIEYHIVHRSEVKGKCAGFLSCAWPVMDNKYIIYTIDDSGVRLHEECHALYQVPH